MNGTKMFRKGDRVVCWVPGSWIDGLPGTIKEVSVISTDNVFGHLVTSGGRETVVHPDNLTREGEELF